MIPKIYIIVQYSITYLLFMAPILKWYIRNMKKEMMK